ncbi:MAG: alanine dehydrogenase [Candidatus Eisenbacteria sp.]|nr:alanine dehydrogenase [Candidatus Eisenbacteria bacterium]
MDIGVPKEMREFENRVGLAPGGVHVLVRHNCRVYVEKDAGVAAGFSDEDYVRTGAEIVYTKEEVYHRADIVLKVTQPQPDEYELFRPGQIMSCFLHLAVAPNPLVEALLEKKITTLAYELAEDEEGHKFILRPMSLICGRMTCQVASRHLESSMGGRGILVSGVPGVPAAEVMIIGAGQVGKNAAFMFDGIGARVTVLDLNFEALQDLDEMLGGRVQTLVATKYNLQKILKYADVVIGAAADPGGKRAPAVVSREMLSLMQDKALIIDVAIDQGGCFETSRPTHPGSPTFVEEGVIHYCVPNMTSNVARTASHMLANAITRTVRSFAEDGFEATIKSQHGLRCGIVTHQGCLVNEEVAKSLKREHKPMEFLTA